MQVSPSLNELMHKIAEHVAKSQDSSAAEDSANFLATCYGAAGCADARARVEELGCRTYVCVWASGFCGCAMSCSNLATGMSTTADC